VKLLAPVDVGWQPVVDAWAASPAGRQLLDFLAQREAAGATIYPPEPLRALRLTPLAQTRAVILGQDPYHGPGQAEGLAFSVPDSVKPPPSLRNIFKELRRDLDLAPPLSGHLGAWARRGVLLLNTSLTVEAGAPASHAKRGWEALTDALIVAAAADPAPKVFMLWGAHAQAKAALIEAAGQRHLLLQANHPSPLSATRPPLPFIGCGHFSTAADWLARQHRPIGWALDAD
jgi:uracil-DNA glycosylase